MGAGNFTLSGRMRFQALPADLTFNPQELGDIIVNLLATKVERLNYTLTADAPQAIAFGGIANGACLIVKTDTPLTATVTSSVGAAQNIPCDPMIIIFGQTLPVTALSLTRSAGLTTNVEVYLVSL